jgi:hypothetical protein
MKRLFTLIPLLCLFALGYSKEASKYPDSLEIIKAKAAEGNPYYMAAYASVLRRGEYGVKIDNDTASKWAKRFTNFKKVNLENHDSLDF